MSFLIPAAIGAVGSWLSGKGKANSANKQNAYATDQARRDYEAQRAMAQEQDQRKLDGIDFLQAVAQGKGYNIPAGAFEALKRRGAYAGMSAQDRIADVPKEGSSVWGALGSGLSTYAGLAGSAAIDQSRRGYLPPAAGSKESGYAWDGVESDIDYYKNLLQLGGKRYEAPPLPEDEFQVGDR